MRWLSLLLLCPWAHAHQTSVTSGGAKLFWPDPHVPLSIKTNTSDLSPGVVTSLIQNSMAQWNSTGVVGLTEASSSVNEVRFTSDFSLYGSAVIGLTEISYNSSGAINKAVILLNDNYTFTSAPHSFGGGSVYLGDVVTHELGHLFGLSHSEVLRSSMFYSSFPGQSTVSADDRSGIHQKYGGGAGKITGRVQGGNHIGVLGVHVQAISKNTGESVGAITDENGSFEMPGLALNDSYYIYTSPIKNVESLPGYYANVQTDFCPGPYAGSFFSACGRENEGYPQAVTLNSSVPTVDVGVVTINCGLKANEDYSYEKIQSVFAPITFWAAEESSIREKSFVGYFRKPANSSWTSWETLRVDLTGIPSPAGKTLKLNFVAHPFGNLLQYEMKVSRSGSLVNGAAISSLPGLGTYTTDMQVSAGLSSTAALNVFDVEIRAQKLSNSLTALTFPSAALFTSDSHLPYLVIAGLWDNSGPLQGTQSILSDNESCLDAPFTYKVSRAKSPSEKAASTGDGDAAAVAGAGCGTIEPPQNGPGPGPGSTLMPLILGFCLAGMASVLGKKSKKFLS